MPGETDFLNDALSQIGAAVITGIDDGSINANHCKRLWPPLRRAILRSHNWNFAEATIQLQQTPNKPLYEYSYEYALPADFIKLTEYNGASTDTSNLTLYDEVIINKYRIRGAFLYTNDGEVKIAYIRDVENMNLWDPLLYQAASTWLASKLALAIAKNHVMAAELLQVAINLGLPLAAAVESQEQSVEPYRVDDLLWGR